MAGQGIRRREVLRILGTAAAAAQFPGFSKWTFACGHIGNAAVSYTHLDVYKRQGSTPLASGRSSQKRSDRRLGTGRLFPLSDRRAGSISSGPITANRAPLPIS